MILAALALAAAQPAPPLDSTAAAEAFLSICWRELARPAALRSTIRNSPLGFARGADENNFEIYRAAGVRLRYREGEGCEFDVVLPSRADGAAAIARVEAAAGLGAPSASVNRPGTETHYRWPRPAETGVSGLSAVLEYGWGPSQDGGPRPARLSLWAYLASGR